MSADNAKMSISLDDLDTRPDLIIPKKPYVMGKVKSIGLVNRVNKDKNDYEAIAVVVVENGTNAEMEALFQAPKKPSECLTEKEQKTMAWKLGQLKHIFGVFAKEEIKGLVWDDEVTFKDLYEGFAKYLPPADEYSKVVCKFKITANDNNLPQFPLFPPFISTQAKPREFKWNPDKDFTEVEKSKPDGADGGSGGSSSDDGGW